MEATTLSVGKSVLNGALSYAKSAVAEELALQLGIRRDQAFITGELEIMQSFLMSAHDEGDGDNKVVKTWVKQVRDVAYIVEDCLQDFAVRVAVRVDRQPWWRTLIHRHDVAKQMKELRAQVDDVSQRNIRYQLIKGLSAAASSSSKQPAAEESAMKLVFGIHGAVEQHNQSNMDLAQLLMVSCKDENSDLGLGVITVWGTSADLRQTSIIRSVYENPNVTAIFPYRAWVGLTHPFDPKDFIQSLVEQFHHSTTAAMLEMDQKTPQQLAQEFNEYVNHKRYLIVINDLSTIEEWDRLKRCFPNNNMGCRIIVSMPQDEVATLCVGQEHNVSKLKQLSAHENIYAFHNMVILFN